MVHRAQYYPQPIRTTEGLIQGYPELIWAFFKLGGVWLGVVLRSTSSGVVDPTVLHMLPHPGSAGLATPWAGKQPARRRCWEGPGSRAAKGWDSRTPRRKRAKVLRMF